MAVTARGQWWIAARRTAGCRRAHRPSAAGAGTPPARHPGRARDSFPRESRRRSAIAPMSASRRAKTSAKTSVKTSVKSNGRSRAKINAQSPGWNRAGPCNRPRHPRPRLRSPPAVAKRRPVVTRTLPIWPSGLKRRSANRRATRAQPPLRHARRRRRISQRAAIRRRLPRHAIRAAASSDRHRPRPISPIKTRPPSTTRSNKRWPICWGGRRKADVG